MARAADLICRFGGEEFVVAAADTPQSQALHLAEPHSRNWNWQRWRFKAKVVSLK